GCSGARPKDNGTSPRSRPRCGSCCSSQPKEGDSVRLRACEMILDRGVGRPNQAVAFEMALTKPLEAMSTEELQEFRTRYTAVVSASPKLIEQVLADEERADPELALDGGEDADNRIGREFAIRAADS